MALTVATCDSTDWDAFVAESPHGSIFAQTRFLRALDSKFDLFVVYDGQTPVLGAPINRTEE